MKPVRPSVDSARVRAHTSLMPWTRKYASHWRCVSMQLRARSTTLSTLLSMNIHVRILTSSGDGVRLAFAAGLVLQANVFRAGKYALHGYQAQPLRQKHAYLRAPYSSFAQAGC